MGRDKVVLGTPRTSVFDIFHRLIATETRVTAHGPLYTGDPAPGAPATPTGLYVTSVPTGLRLGWALQPEGAYRTYEVYEGTSAGFTPDTTSFTNRAAVVSVNNATILHAAGTGPWYFKVCAVSTTGVRSAFASTSSANPDIITGSILQTSADPTVPRVVIGEDIAGGLELHSGDPLEENPGRLFPDFLDAGTPAFTPGASLTTGFASPDGATIRNMAGLFLRGERADASAPSSAEIWAQEVRFNQAPSPVKAAFNFLDMWLSADKNYTNHAATWGTLSGTGLSYLALGDLRAGDVIEATAIADVSYAAGGAFFLGVAIYSGSTFIGFQGGPRTLASAVSTQINQPAQFTLGADYTDVRAYLMFETSAASNIQFAWGSSGYLRTGLWAKVWR
jgi:hypothetical protein